MNETTVQRVERACAALVDAGQPLTFTAVATRAQVGRATLYRDPQLRATVDEHRIRQSEARTLTGLTREIAHLHVTLDTVAANVRRHEERLRRLERSQQRTPR